jgi:DNA-binding PadR family transcriptional regulator
LPGVLTRLLVLWLLSEGPLHGYRIRRVLRDDSMGFWFAVEDASIYSMLRTLVREGRAREAEEEREGKRSRRLYAITREGRAHLRDLVRRAIREPATGGDLLDAALAARSEIDEAEVPALLEARLAALRERLARLERVAAGAPDAAMGERARLRLRAEVRWTRTALSRKERR